MSDHRPRCICFPSFPEARLFQRESHELPENKQNHINCGIRHVTVPIATRILIANVRHIGVSNICVINLVYFKMQV